MIRFLEKFWNSLHTSYLIGSVCFMFKIELYRIASNQLYLNEKLDFIKVVQFLRHAYKKRILIIRTPDKCCKLYQ